MEYLLTTAKKIEISTTEHYMEYTETKSMENPEIAPLFKHMAEEALVDISNGNYLILI